MAGGRPTIYTTELADKICNLISMSNRGLVHICKEEGMPSRITVHQWILDNPEFSNKYARAREDQAEFLAEEMLSIADDSSGDLDRIDDFGNRIENKEFINRSKLKVETRKWIASKLKPKSFGDKVQTEHSGSVAITPITGMEIK